MRIFTKILRICALAALLPALSVSLYGQSGKITVQGTVVDVQNQPVIGANVLEKGTMNGSATGTNGAFEISVDPSATLLVTFLGYKDKEVKVNPATTSLKIVLDEDLGNLEEVVVIGYGQQKKVTVTGSISQVSSSELVKSPVTNLANALAGNLSGFTAIQSSGQPGADDPQIFIRGIGSLDAERAKPLIMVDGVERSFFKLDPNEVESISVLKDASATAVFGVRGANGVILVTTKRGTPGKMDISVSTSVSVQKPIRLYDFTNSYDYGMLYNERFLNDNPGTAPENLPFKPELLEAFRTHSDPLLYPDTDWQDLILKKVAVQSMHNVSISGGTESVRYFTSVGVTTQDGLYKSFDVGYNSNIRYNRYNYRANIDIDITKTTLLAINLGGRMEDFQEPNTKDGNFDPQMADFLPFAGVGLYEGKWVRGHSDNLPFANGALENGDAFEKFYGRGYNRRIRNEINLDVSLRQKLDMLTEGLSVSLKGSYNTYYMHRKNWSKSMPFYTAHRDETGELYFLKERDETMMTYGESSDRGRDWYLEASLNYNRAFGDHHVGALVLYNQWREAYPDPSRFNYTNIPRGYVGLVGRVTYDYAYKYIIDFNAGYNGSENFAPGKRYGFFPAVSAGWVISQEGFMQNQEFVTNLKIKGSVGLVGNDLVTSGERFYYLPDEYSASNGGYNFGVGTTTALPGAVETKIGNADVTWEKALKTTIGLEFGLFKGKLNGSIDLFRETRNDILTSINTTPAYLAVQMPIVNIGEVENKGFEVELMWRQKVSDFEYWIKANCSYAKNKIIYKDEIPKEYPWQYETGRPVGQLFGYIFDGFVTEEDLASGTLPDHKINLQPGDAKYKDLNHDGQITDLDVAAIGHPIYPQMVGGLSLGFSYKGFDFSMLWSGATMVSRYVNNSLRIPFGTLGNMPLQQYMFDGRWTPETADTAKLPRLSATSATNNYSDSTLWLKDTSYARLKNLQMGYVFSNTALKKIGVESLRIYMSAENLWTIDSYKISDPENTVRSYPLQTIVSLGANINF